MLPMDDQTMGENCGDSECHGLTEYCDSYESRCRSCEEICVGDLKKFDLCAQKCSGFLRDVVFKRLDEIGNLKTIMIVTMAMTAFALFILIGLVILKVQGRKRRKKVVDRVVPDPQFTLQHLPNSYQQVTPPSSSNTVTNGTFNRGNRTITHGTSMQTVSTRLEDVQENGILQTTRLSGRSGKNGDPDGKPRRTPSDDRVPGMGNNNNNYYDNRSMSTPSPRSVVSPSSRNLTQVTSPQRAGENRLPPINTSSKMNGSPYTISHSQVV